MQKWFEVIPELVKAGDNVRIYDSKLECYTLLEVLKVCPKTLRVLKFDEKKEIEYPVYIQHKKLGLIPREIGKDEETPKIFIVSPFVKTHLDDFISGLGFPDVSN